MQIFNSAKPQKLSYTGNMANLDNYKQSLVDAQGSTRSYKSPCRSRTHSSERTKAVSQAEAEIPTSY